ncbi:TetR/AcrR family transcriptional regulator [Actinomycetospora aeridis]|uniref:TetR family transcriptional regulator n=1 Tax=Actinomycetospora aeridis TaxID=3129231 RepID=A0ABU8N6Y7_9PSEU
MGDEITDGRLLKGQRRRQAIIAATIAVIGRSGLSGVSQRAVAAEAGVPGSAVSYYFPTVDGLLLAVMVDVNDRYIADLERCLAQPDPLDALAELVVGSGSDASRGTTAAEFELFMLAGRGERWRDEYRRWVDALERFFARYVDREASSLASVTIDGLILRIYCFPASLGVADVRSLLRSMTGA